ncbi:hypothetical protein LOD99_8190 [Oopsacas minuta]|uniref:Uncharacterized protein n=1 Tax=Oopsacas minuta TaxID=111878 RepID=A0AAV7JIX8_9METZ|nr:hypothetical protein LOD99_8190 [Oopsacas minuta]
MQSDRNTEWTEKLQTAVLAANTQTKISTSYTPIFLMFGRDFDSSNLLNLITSPHNPRLLNETDTSNANQFILTVEFMASKDDNFNLKWRAYIEFRTILKIQPVQIFSKLQEILYVDCPSRSTVERWAARLRSGDAVVTDLPRSGRPVSATTSENITTH